MDVGLDEKRDGLGGRDENKTRGGGYVVTPPNKKLRRTVRFILSAIGEAEQWLRKWMDIVISSSTFICI